MKPKIKIPKSFQLGGKTIHVQFQDDLITDKNSLGLAVYSENKIMIQPVSKTLAVSEESTEQTFLHELVHWILMTMSEDELRQNEKFVDLFAVFLHQFLKTAEYK